VFDSDVPAFTEFTIPLSIVEYHSRDTPFTFNSNDAYQGTTLSLAIGNSLTVQTPAFSATPATVTAAGARGVTGSVQQGEIITVTATLSLPLGSSQPVITISEIGANGRVDLNEFRVSILDASGGSYTQGQVVSGSGTSAVATFGTISNTANEYQVAIEADFEVLSNNRGDTIQFNAVFTNTGGLGTSTQTRQTSTLTVRRGEMSTTVSPGTTTGDAYDVIARSATICNDGTSDGVLYNAVLDYSPTSPFNQIDSIAISSGPGAVVPGVNAFTLTVPELAVGACTTVDFSYTVPVSVENGKTYQDNGVSSHFDTINTALATEITGASPTFTLETYKGSVVTQVVATSDTGSEFTASSFDAIREETVTVQMTITLIDGTNVVSAVLDCTNDSFLDKTDLEIVSNRVVSIPDGITTDLSVGESVTPVGNTVTFNFGTFTNELGAGVEQIVVEVVYAVPVTGTPGQTGYTVSSQMVSATNVDGPLITGVLVEPGLKATITWSPTKLDNVQAGDTFTFSIVIAHSDISNGDSFDVTVNDSGSDFYTIVPSSYTLAPSVGTTVSAGDNVDDTTLSVKLDTLPLQQLWTITYKAVVTSAIRPDTEHIFNSISITFRIGADTAEDKVLGIIPSAVFDMAGADPVATFSAPSTDLAETLKGDDFEFIAIGETATITTTLLPIFGTNPLLLTTASVPNKILYQLDHSGKVSAISEFVTGSLLPVGEVVPADGDMATAFDFGPSVLNSGYAEEGQPEQSIAVESYLSVPDNVNNVRGKGLSASIQFTSAEGSAVYNANYYFVIVEPELSGTYGCVPDNPDVLIVEAGDTFTCTMYFNHVEVSDGPAYDFTLTDPLTSEYWELVPDSWTSTSEGAYLVDDPVFTVVVPVLDVFDGPIEITYQVSVSELVRPGLTIDLPSTAEAEYFSSPFVDSRRRYGFIGTVADLSVVGKEVGFDFIFTNSTLDDTPLSTTAATLNLGEEFTLEATVTLIQGTNPIVLNIDSLDLGGGQLGTKLLDLVWDVTIPVGDDDVEIDTAGASVTYFTNSRADYPDTVSIEIGDVINRGFENAIYGQVMTVVLTAYIDPTTTNRNKLEINRLRASLDTTSTSTPVLRYSQELTITATDPVIRALYNCAPIDDIAWAAGISAGDRFLCDLDIFHSPVSTGPAYNAVIIDTLEDPYSDIVEDTITFSTSNGALVNYTLEADGSLHFNIAEMTYSTEERVRINYEMVVIETIIAGEPYVIPNLYDPSLSTQTTDGDHFLEVSQSTSILGTTTDGTADGPTWTFQVSETSLVETASTLTYADVSIGESVDLTLEITAFDGTMPVSVTIAQQDDPNAPIARIRVTGVVTAISDAISGSLIPVGDEGVYSDNLLGDGVTDSVTFNLGDLVNSAWQVDLASVETVVLTASILVLNDANNVNGTGMDITASFDWGQGVETLSISGAVREQFINYQYSCTPLSSTWIVVSGDVYECSMTIFHTVLSEVAAYGINATDVFSNAAIDYVPGSVSVDVAEAVINRGDLDTSDNFEVILDVLPLGDTMVITFQARANDEVRPNEPVSPNTVVLRYSSSGDVGGRAVVAPKTVVGQVSGVGAEPTSSAALTGSTLPTDADNEEILYVAIGEVVDLDVTLFPIFGTTYFNLSIAQVTEGGSTIDMSASVSATEAYAAGAPVLDAPGTQVDNDADGYFDEVTFDFGEIVNSGLGDRSTTGGVTISASFTVPSDNQPFIGENFTVVVSASYPGGTLSHTLTFGLIGPSLTVSAVRRPAGVSVDAGDRVTITVTISHADDSSADAYDVLLEDMFPDPNFRYAPGTATGGNGVDSSTDTALSYSVPTILVGESVDVSFAAVITEVVEPATSITKNSTTVSYGSAPGVYADTVITDDIVVPTKNATAVATLVSSSIADTPCDVEGDCFMSVGETFEILVSADLIDGTQNVRFEITSSAGDVVFTVLDEDVAAAVANLTTSNYAATIDTNSCVLDFGDVLTSDGADKPVNAPAPVLALPVYAFISTVPEGLVNITVHVFVNEEDVLQVSAIPDITPIIPDVSIDRTDEVIQSWVNAEGVVEAELHEYTVTVSIPDVATAAPAYDIFFEETISNPAFNIVGGSVIFTDNADLTFDDSSITVSGGSVNFGSSSLSVSYQVNMTFAKMYLTIEGDLSSNSTAVWKTTNDSNAATFSASSITLLGQKDTSITGAPPPFFVNAISDLNITHGNLTIGETVEYDILVGVPFTETTRNLMVTVEIAEGYIITSQSVVRTVGANIQGDGLASARVTPLANDTSPSFTINFGPVSTIGEPDTITAGDYIIISFDVRVANIPSNKNNGTPLPVRVTYNFGGSSYARRNNDFTVSGVIAVSYVTDFNAALLMPNNTDPNAVAAEPALNVRAGDNVTLYVGFEMLQDNPDTIYNVQIRIRVDPSLNVSLSLLGEPFYVGVPPVEEIDSPVPAPAPTATATSTVGPTSTSTATSTGDAPTSTGDATPTLMPTATSTGDAPTSTGDATPTLMPTATSTSEPTPTSGSTQVKRVFSTDEEFLSTVVSNISSTSHHHTFPRASVEKTYWYAGLAVQFDGTGPNGADYPAGKRYSVQVSVRYSSSLLVGARNYDFTESVVVARTEPNYDQCSLKVDLCDHACTFRAPYYYDCSCYEGYELDADGYSCNDIDECDLNLDECDDICKDGLKPAGSYTCACNEGRILGSNGRTCSDPLPETCGNNVIDEGETCDSNSLGCVRCQCSDSLDYEPTDPVSLFCQPIEVEPYCGDFFNNQDSEECDGGIGCTADCLCKDGFETRGKTDCKRTVIPVGGCGDGRLQDGEECEPPFVAGCLETCLCDAEAGLIPDGFGGCEDAVKCGNGKLDEGEECDEEAGSCIECLCDRENNYFPRSFSRSCVYKEDPPYDPCNGNGTEDKCGNCKARDDPTRNDCLGCDKRPYSGYEVDECGICRAASDPNFGKCSDPDCEEGYVKDQCGACQLPGSTGFDSCLDCAYVPFGDWIVNDCDVCVAPDDETDIFDLCPGLGCDYVQDSGYEFDSCDPAQCLHPVFDEDKFVPVNSTDSDPTCPGEVEINILPLLFCWDTKPNENSDNGLGFDFIAFIGYVNRGDAVTVPVGPSNKFALQENRGQYTYFKKGVSAQYPASKKIRWDGSEETWTLGNNQLTVDLLNNYDGSLAQYKCPEEFESGASATMPDFEGLNSKKRFDYQAFMASLLLKIRVALAKRARVDVERIDVGSKKVGVDKAPTPSPAAPTPAPTPDTPSPTPAEEKKDLPPVQVNIEVKVRPRNAASKRQSGLDASKELSTAEVSQILTEDDGAVIKEALAENGVDMDEDAPLYTQPLENQLAGESIPTPSPYIGAETLHPSLLLLFLVSVVSFFL
jgi:hypothetical protein